MYHVRSKLEIDRNTLSFSNIARLTSSSKSFTLCENSLIKGIPVKKTSIVFITVSAALVAVAFPAFAESDYSKRVRIATVNAGLYANEYCDSDSGIELEDSSPFYGAYLQWVETGKFQANLFGYVAPDVNYSRVSGIHCNADGYFLKNALGAFAAGIDFERIDISMDAGDAIKGLENFGMENAVTFALFRGGFRFSREFSPALSATLFPYGGLTLERVDGEVTVNPMGPPAFTPETTSDISDSLTYFSWGTNLTVRAFHCLELTGKYMMRMRDGDNLSTVTAQANVYLPCHLAATYQFKYMEMPEGSDRYHLFGLGFVF